MGVEVEVDFTELSGLVQRDFVEVTVSSSRINNALALVMNAVRALGKQVGDLASRSTGGEQFEQIFSELAQLKDEGASREEVAQLATRLSDAEQESRRLESDLLGVRDYACRLEERLKRQEERRIPDIAPLTAEVEALQKEIRKERESTEALEGQVARLRHRLNDSDEKLASTAKDLAAAEQQLEQLRKVFGLRQADMDRVLTASQRRPSLQPSPCTEYLMKLPVFELLDRQKADRSELQAAAESAETRLKDAVELFETKLLNCNQRIVLKLDKSIFEEFVAEVRTTLSKAIGVEDELRRVEKELESKANRSDMLAMTGDLEKCKADRGELLRLASKDDLEPVGKDIGWLRERLNELATTVDLQLRQLQKELAVVSGGGGINDITAELERLRKRADALGKTDQRLDDVKAERDECDVLRDNLQMLYDELSGVRDVLRKLGAQVPSGMGKLRTVPSDPAYRGTQWDRRGKLGTPSQQELDLAGELKGSGGRQRRPGDGSEQGSNAGGPTYTSTHAVGPGGGPRFGGGAGRGRGGPGGGGGGGDGNDGGGAWGGGDGGGYSNAGRTPPGQPLQQRAGSPQSPGLGYDDAVPVDLGTAGSAGAHDGYPHPQPRPMSAAPHAARRQWPSAQRPQSAGAAHKLAVQRRISVELDGPLGAQMGGMGGMGGVGGVGGHSGGGAGYTSLPLRPDASLQMQSSATIVAMQHIPAGVRMGRPSRLTASDGTVTNATVTARSDMEHFHTSPRRDSPSPMRGGSPPPQALPG